MTTVPETYPIPPTGRITLTLDWADVLATPPRCDTTLVSAAWALPVGITLVTSSVDGTKAIVTINCINLKLKGKFSLVCSATLSNGDVLPAAANCVALYSETRRSAEVCPTP